MALWMWSTETWLLLLLLLLLVLLFDYRAKSLFRSLGVPGPRPLPFFGTMFEYRKGFHVFDMESYKRFGKIWGVYDVWQPALCVMDTDIIKTVMVKECYSTFTNRRDFDFNGELHDALTVVRDEDWRRIRSVLSPSFTSGRLKEMFGIMKIHSSTLMKNLQKIADQGGRIDTKEVFGPYALDVVTSTSFSVDIDSLNNPSDPFVANAKKLDFDFYNPIIFIAALFPFLIPLMEKMNFSLFPVSATQFFFTVLQKIKAERLTDKHKNRVDFLQLMIDSQKLDDGKETHKGKQLKSEGLSDHEILSQAMVFIVAGYGTSSSTLSFFFHSIATNPNSMKKLQQEIDQTFPNQAPVLYEVLMNMDYLDAALSETLRLYPVAPRLERVCKKTVEINGLTIPQGTVVMAPVFPLHRDPEYWPDPETFDPERFSKENKESIDPYTYMPFGAGPRNCIGMRFAVLAMKLAIVEILRRFDVSVCEETKVPLELGVSGLLAPKDPIKLRLTPRDVSHTEDVCNNNLSSS